MDEFDTLLDAAARIAVENGKISTAMIQRELAIGFNRSGRIINQLEQAGIIGEFKYELHREVLIKNLFDLDNLLSKLNFKQS